MMILRALTGSLDVPGGHVLLDDLPLADVTLAHQRPFGQKPLGAAQYPLFIGCNDFVPGDVLIEDLSDAASVRAMIIGGGNPALTWPNTARVQAALRRLDFLVVLELHMTPTARLADIVLPMASPLEKTQLIIKSGPFGHDRPMWHVMLRKPVGTHQNCRPLTGPCSDWWFWHQLALKMGYGVHYPWSNVQEAIDFQLAPLGLCCAELYENPSGVYYGQAHAYRGYEAQGFKTPSGKVELWSHTLEAYGYDPLPAYTEPAESPISQPELAERYPLVLNAGRRVAVYTHSRHRTLPSLQAKEPEPWAEIHPETAGAYDIDDGDVIEVETLRGCICLKARVTEKVRPGVVGVLHGWEEANANLLTDHLHGDPIFACPPLRAALCRISKHV
jgi:anaerobic selenocysteine-containing dehydrogenase